MNPVLEVPVAGQHRHQQVRRRATGQFGLQLARIADAGRAAEPDDLEPQRIQRALQAGLFQHPRDPARSRRQ